MAKRAKTLDDTPDERDPLLIEVGARIFEGRRSLKLSQTQLGSLAGVGLQTVFQAENGSQNVTLKTLSRLASALGVGLKDLLPNSPDQKTPDPSQIAEALVAELGRAVMLSKRLAMLMAAFEGRQQNDDGQ